jgi:hypothetical protein
MNKSPTSSPAATTPAQLSRDLVAAILKHVPDDQFAEVFANLPPGAQARLARKYSPRPTRTIVKIIRHRK